MQQKTGSSSASASADNGNFRRPMLSYGLTQFAAAPPQPLQQAYLGSLGSSGMPMNMSDMQNSIRSFAPLNQQQQQQQQSSQATTESSTASFWRSADQSQHHQPQHLHTYKPNGLDMEFNDFLSTTAPSSRESNASAMAHSSLHSAEDTTGDDVGMGEVATTFQLPSSFASASSVAPLSLAHASLLQNRNLSATPSSRSASPNSDVSSTPSNSAAMATSVARPAVPVATTPNGQSPSDYSRFVDSTDEPDLSQHKIEQKNEKCQYHNCPNRARVSQAYGKFCNRHVIVAPCGFPGCRDKALLHSSMCDKHLAEGKDALHRILANRAQNVPVCRTFGCFKNDQGRGYCRGHEKLLMATGRLPKHINKRRLNSAYTMCSYPNCNKHSQRNHLCRTHGNVVLKQAEDIVKNSSTGETFEDVLARLQKEIRRCTHPTCTKNSQRDRLCTMHYYEKHNLQRDGGSRDSDSQLSSTDGGGESDLETAVCSIDGCNLHAFSKRGLCKFHSGELTSSASGTPNSKSSQEGSSGRHRPLCSIQGCGKVAPYASGLCAHHGNKTNQAIQITRMAPPASVSSSATVCGVQACTSNVLPGNAYCEYHTTQRRLQTGGDSAGTRPSLGDTGGYSNQGSHSFMGAASPDPTGIFAFDGFASLATGTTGRMASMSVSSATVAENDARHALVNLNNSSRPGGSGGDGDRSTGSFLSAPTTCSNPMCSRECFGRDYCDSCMGIFSPLVVSVGDSNNGNPYQLSSLNNTSTNQSLQPEPEGDAMWDGSSEPKSKSKDVCRANECGAPVARFGLCDDHVRLFMAGSLSVDEITLRSRQIREEKERDAALDAALASAMKQTGNPQIKKYFCKSEGCDKQAQKRGLCKRHFRMHEMSASGKPEGSSFEDSNQQLEVEVNSLQHFCQFPGCGENVNLPVTLCPSHSAASFCWAAGCETLVESPQFCDYHVYRRECGFEGCSFTALAASSGCANHIMERKCSHDHCEHYAVPRSARCRLHPDDCTQQPCALCDLYGVSGRSSSGVYAMRGSDGKTTIGYAHQGASNNNNSMEFANERELARRSAFHDGRRM